jgi:hypothetical protein
MPFGLFEKGADVTLTVDRPQGPYHPGDTVHATIGLQVDKPVTVREVRVVLLLQQKYKTLVEREVQQTSSTGTATTTKETVEQMSTNEKEVDKQIPIREGELSAEQTTTVDLRIPPDAVPVYTSPNIETHWVIKVTVDRPMASDANAELQLPLIVPPPGHYARPGEYGNATNMNVAPMRFSLPKLEYVNGETLNGELIIEPREAFEGREVRIELLHEERVTEGSKPNELTTSDQKVQIAGTTKFQPGTPQKYDFSLAIAPKGQPTYVDPKASSRWILKATIDRPWANDAEVTQEIYVYSGTRAG